MSRIYSNDPLTSLPVKNIAFDKVWNPADCHQQGTGVLLEGQVAGRSRFVVIDSNKQKHRYFLFNLQVRRAHRRAFNEANLEIEPNFSATEKVRTGFLHSSYKVVAKGKSDILNYNELVSLTQPVSLLSLFDIKNPDSHVAVLIPEDKLEKLEISDRDEVRLKTKGNGPFLESIGKIDSATSTVSNYTGDEDLGNTWTSRIMAVKGQKEDGGTAAAKSDVNSCVADDEWDD